MSQKVKKILESPVNWDSFFMHHVFLCASKSKDPRTKVGAVLVKDGVIISEGYNGFPRGVHDFESRYTNRPLKYKFVVHAEANAILNAVRHGVNTTNSVLYTQSMPCCECAKAVIQAGIVKIMLYRYWPSMGKAWERSCRISAIMFEEASIPVFELNEVLNVKAYCNGEVKII